LDDGTAVRKRSCAKQRLLRRAGKTLAKQRFDRALPGDVDARFVREHGIGQASLRSRAHQNSDQCQPHAHSAILLSHQARGVPPASRKRDHELPRFKLTIEYAGTKYSGWQIQQNARTVQGEIDAAVRTVTGRKDFELYGSGRTDAGVHALAQIAHLDVATTL